MRNFKIDILKPLKSSCYIFLLLCVMPGLLRGQHNLAFNVPGPAFQNADRLSGGRFYSPPVNYQARKIALGTVSIGLTAGSLVYLNQAWYKQYSSSSFHFFNDNSEWLQMDKCGHTFTTYQTGRMMMDAMEWCGSSKKATLFIGGLSGFAYMTAIEVMDGYSSGWGFSWGDMTANAIGAGFAIGQKALWKRQRIQLKFSYRSSPYAQYRPDQLGSSFSERILKDYNAQTYWLSVNISSFLGHDSKFPRWLNVAVGYGANGMIGAMYNNIVVEDEQGNTKTFDRYRQVYLSLDVDLTRIRTRSKFLKTVFTCVNIIKVPFPNLELSQGGLRGNWF